MVAEEFEDGFADELGSGFWGRRPSAGGAMESLFQQVLCQTIAVDFLTRKIVKDHAVEIGHHYR